MSTLSDRELLAYAVGALEPGRAREVEEELRASPLLRARLHLLVQQLPPRSARADPWPVPAAGGAWGRAWGAPRPPASPLEAFMDEAVHTQGELELHVTLADPADDRRLLVLRRLGGRWTAVWPGSPEELRRLQALPGGAVRRIRLSAGEEAGTTEWAVIALPEEVEIHWEREGAARWVEAVEVLELDPTLALRCTVDVEP